MCGVCVYLLIRERMAFEPGLGAKSWQHFAGVSRQRQNQREQAGMAWQAGKISRDSLPCYPACALPFPLEQQKPNLANGVNLGTRPPLFFLD